MEPSDTLHAKRNSPEGSPTLPLLQFSPGVAVLLTNLTREDQVRVTALAPLSCGSQGCLAAPRGAPSVSEANRNLIGPF
jgi:hypothetical protein